MKVLRDLLLVFATAWCLAQLYACDNGRRRVDGRTVISAETQERWEKERKERLSCTQLCEQEFGQDDDKMGLEYTCFCKRKK